MYVSLVIFSLASLYIFVRRHYAKWKCLDIPYDEPNIPYGSLLKVRQMQVPFGMALYDVYERFRGHRFVGMHLLFKPVILLRDANLVRKILTTDFVSFHDRGIYVDEEHDPMSANLLALKGNSWRTLRAKLTPAFSSGKLRGMFGTVDDVANKMIQHLNKTMADGKSHTMEIKQLITTYTVDVVGSVIFGLDIDSFSNPHNEFRNLIDRLFNESSIFEKIRGIMAFVCPPITVFLSRFGVRDPIIYRLRDIAKRTIEFREKNNVIRKDLMQLLIQLRNTGKISEDNDDLWNVESTANNLKSMSIDMIAANAFLFYMAGSETTATSVSYTIYELAMNSDILEKVQKEVDECLLRHQLKGGESLSYEAIHDMKYLDLCVMETTRKYPAIPFLNRECTQDYYLSEENFTIKKGSAVIISMMGIHRDSEYFPNPMDYKPERFLAENMEYNPVAYMPFGEGPRTCIAQRMGLINIKVALAKILANFNIEPMPRKEVEFMFHTAPVLVPKDGLRVTLTKRK